MSFFLGLGALITLWIGSRDVINGRITVGQFVAFNSYLTMLSWPVIAFGWVTNMLQRGMASWKRMLEVLETEPAIADSVGTSVCYGRSRCRAGPWLVPIEQLTPRVTSSNPRRDRVPRSRLLLRRHAGPRSRLGDESRRGKPSRWSGRPAPASRRSSACWRACTSRRRARCSSTGIDVRDIPLSVLRRSIGFVPQEPFLFSDTVADNVAFGLDAIVDGTAKGGAPAAVREGEAGGAGWGRERQGLRSEHAAANRAGGGGRPSGQGCRRFSARDTRRWWANGASRCRAVRSSAPPSRAPSSSIRRS